MCIYLLGLGCWCSCTYYVWWRCIIWIRLFRLILGFLVSFCRKKRSTTFLLHILHHNFFSSNNDATDGWRRSWLLQAEKRHLNSYTRSSGVLFLRLVHRFIFNDESWCRQQRLAQMEGDLRTGFDPILCRQIKEYSLIFTNIRRKV